MSGSGVVNPMHIRVTIISICYLVRAVHKNDGDKWKNYFFKIERDIEMVQNPRNKRTRGHFTAKTQINMTLSLYLCSVN